MGNLKHITVYELLKETADKYPKDYALTFPAEDRDVTYEDFIKDVHKAAKSFIKMGYEKGDKISICSTNTYYMVVVMMGAASIGVIPVPLNVNYKKKGLNDLIDFSDSKSFFCIKKYRKYDFTDAVKELNIKNIYFLSDEDCGEYPNINDFYKMGEAIGDDVLDAFIRKVNIDDIYMFQYTSGTTGKPKGALLSVYSSVNVGIQFGEIMNLTKEDVMITALPLFHCFSNIDVVLACFATGSRLVLIDLFSPDKMLDAIEKYKCTTVCGVPTMFVMMYERENFNDYNLNSLYKGIIGGSVCVPRIMDKIVEKFGFTGITNAFGTTETGGLIAGSYPDEGQYSRLYTCGHAVEHVECKVINPETEEEAEENIPGELYVRGYNLMKEYYKNEEVTRQTIDREGWFHTGDMAVMEDGELIRIIGRYKDLIVRGGENISPSEIENEIIKLKGVESVEIVGVKDDKYGEEIAVFMIVNNEFTKSDNDIREYIKKRLAFYKIPKYIFYVNNFPMTSSGKVQKYKLSKMAEEMLNIS